MRSRYASIALGIIPIVALILLWSAVAASGVASRAMLPSPLAVFLRTIDRLGDARFLGDVGTTLFRLVSGFAIGLAVGLSLALLAIVSANARMLLNALVKLLAPIPKIALYPVLILVLGFGHGSKIALVAAEAAFPIYLAAYQGMLNVDRKLVWAARAAGASNLHALFFVTMPAALPSILTGCRVAMIISCIVVFLSEMISATEGLGYVLINAARNFKMIDMFVPIILISALGLMLSALFNIIRRRLLVGFPDT